MRIGMFTESYPPLINGVSTSVQTLIAELERAGHSVCVFTSHYPRYTDERPDVYRYPSVNAIVEPDYVLPIPFSARIKATIPKLGLDLIHSHSPFMLGMIARHVARQLRLPLVSTNHTLYTEYAHYVPLLPLAFTRRFLIRWMRDYYNSCDHVLAPSELTRQRLLQWYGVRSPVTVIPTGIPEPPYVLARSTDTKRELGMSPEARLLLYVGRLAPEKNLEMLLHAFQIICGKTSETYLVIAGSGKSAPALQRQAQQLGIAPRVVFTGFLGRTKLDPLYKASDLFLFPSTTETQGLAVGEALAAGTPAIVVNGGGAPEAIQDGVNGFVVENEPSLMADRALRLLADEPLRRRLATNARLGAAELTPERVAGRVIRLYEALIEGRRTAGTAASKSTGGGAGKTPGYEVPRDT
jgi:1,2-diacylglycerol 3-alpha-glucosyltransferase